MSKSTPKGPRRRQAAPLSPSPGARHDVTLRLIRRGGSEGWIEVQVIGRRERFFVTHMQLVGDLVEQVLQGGHWVVDTPERPVKNRHSRA